MIRQLARRPGLDPGGDAHPDPAAHRHLRHPLRALDGLRDLPAVRIKEEYDRTGDNALEVADGLAKSARVITAGAAVMVSVFGSFILGGHVLGKMFGIGLATAVLVDATVIRMVLVPATMELLGDRNWWLPGWLDRLLPNVHVEGPEITDDEYDLRDAIGRQRDPADSAATTSV